MTVNEGQFVPADAGGLGSLLNQLLRCPGDGLGLLLDYRLAIRVALGEHITDELFLPGRPLCFSLLGDFLNLLPYLVPVVKGASAYLGFDGLNEVQQMRAGVEELLLALLGDLELQTERSLDGDPAVAEVVVVKNLAGVGRLECTVLLAYLRDILIGDESPFVA